VEPINEGKALLSTGNSWRSPVTTQLAHFFFYGEEMMIFFDFKKFFIVFLARIWNW
jgi:hypothetical protein